MKSIDGLPVLGGKGDMGAGLRGVFEADPEKRFSVGAIAGAVLVGIQPLDAERTQGPVIKRLRPREIGDPQCNVIQHVALGTNFPRLAALRLKISAVKPRPRFRRKPCYALSK